MCEIKDIYPDVECIPLGSVGKKDGYNGDIDIGVKIDSIDKLYDIISNVFNYTETVDMKSLYIVSMKYPYKINDEKIKFVSVDFIQVIDTEYTKFRYYCPDYRKGESQYKVGSKIMFMGMLLNHTFKNTDENDIKKYLFDPIGLYLKHYNRNTREYYKEFITLDPQEIVDMLFYNSTPDICNSVESLWDGIHSNKFKYPNEVQEIEINFFINSYRKGWEELIKPEDFKLSYWTVEEINHELEKYKIVREVNMILDNYF